MLPHDYDERVYAGVLGKVIAVYLGRPFEGWTYQRIVDELGDITGYVNHRADVALKNHLLVVTDDDISGTFIFPRALDRYGADPTSVQIGQSWLNEIIEERTVLWWGGLGNSTEHTAYLRMKAGIAPPDSGSIARNGRVVAEQVGAQIFVEGFAMTRPGDPGAAADLAERAARVSHDGEAINAARVVAALVAGAFTESDMDTLLDSATALIPATSLIYQVIADVREWASGGDWRATRARIEQRYGYHRYGGNCHVVPNHATVIHALAHSGGDFATAMTVVNTSGWDTDSNAGNVGAICGVRGGLAGLPEQLRAPVADRLYLPSPVGGATITDAVREARRLAGHGRAWAGAPARPPRPRFDFDLPGAVRGFTVLAGAGRVYQDAGRLTIEVESAPVTVATPTFIPPEARDMPIYGLVASPTVYPGQTVTVSMRAQRSAQAQLVVLHYTGDDTLRSVTGPLVALPAGEPATLRWTVPDLGGQPATYLGVTVTGPVELDHVSWGGTPTLALGRPADGGRMWRRAWVDAVDRWDERWPEPFRLVQNRGTGLLIHGACEWRDYTVTADVTPHLVRAAGIAARVQGLRQYYALELAERDTVRLLHHDRVVAEAPMPWEFGRTYTLSLRVAGDRLTGLVDGQTRFDIHDRALEWGGIALTVTEGRTATRTVQITPNP